MHVTAHMLLESYRQTQREILELGVSATEKAKRHRVRWERMAELLNEKLADHTAYVEPDDEDEEEPSLSSQSNERSSLFTYYLSRSLPGDLITDLREELKHWFIDLIAIRMIGIENLTEDEIALLACNDEVKCLFKLEQLDLDTAGDVLDEMIRDAKERGLRRLTP